MKSIGNLLAGSDGDKDRQTDRLFIHLYDDLCRLASKYLQNEPARSRLSSASLVHQAYVRMVDQSKITWKGKTHFFAVGATVMRRILVDHARKVQSLKRGGAWQQRSLDDELTFRLNEDREIVALDELLNLLATLNERQAKIVELRFFGGLTMTEIASELGLGLRTIEQDWSMARAWIRRELKKELNGSIEGSTQPDQPKSKTDDHHET